MTDQLAKYGLHIRNDILFIYNFILKMPPFYATNLALKRNLRNLKQDHWFVCFSVSHCLVLTMNLCALEVRRTWITLLSWASTDFEIDIDVSMNFTLNRTEQVVPKRLMVKALKSCVNTIPDPYALRNRLVTVLVKMVDAGRLKSQRVSVNPLLALTLGNLHTSCHS